jgi:hypothetical protein
MTEQDPWRGISSLMENIILKLEEKVRLLIR